MFEWYIYFCLTYFILVEFEHELQDLGELFDERLLLLQVLRGAHAAAHQRAQQVRHDLRQPNSWIGTLLPRDKVGIAMARFFLFVLLFWDF